MLVISNYCVSIYVVYLVIECVLMNQLCYQVCIFLVIFSVILVFIIDFFREEVDVLKGKRGFLFFRLFGLKRFNIYVLIYVMVRN